MADGKAENWAVAVKKMKTARGHRVDYGNFKPGLVVRIEPGILMTGDDPNIISVSDECELFITKVSARHGDECSAEGVIHRLDDDPVDYAFSMTCNPSTGKGTMTIPFIERRHEDR